jgi:uncharacterized protein (TIGR02246 family)
MRKSHRDLSPGINSVFLPEGDAVGIRMRSLHDNRMVSRKEKMKTKLLALISLVLSFGVPAFAQLASTPDPQLTQAIQADVAKLGDALKNADAAGAAALFTENATLVSPTGSYTGQKAIEEHFTNLFKAEHISDLSITQDPDRPQVIGKLGKFLWLTGGWEATIQFKDKPAAPVKGYFSSLLRHDGDAWKVGLLTEVRAPNE